MANLKAQFDAYRKSVSTTADRPHSDMYDILRACELSPIKIYEFTRWHHMRRGQVYSDMPLLVDSFGTLQVDWSVNWPGANIGIDYATNAIEKVGMVPEIVTASLYDGDSYLRPGKGDPNARYGKDIEIIEQLLNLGVKKVMVGNAGAEIRYSHLESPSGFITKSITFLDKIRKLWGNKLCVAVSHVDHVCDIVYGNGEVTQWMTENNIENHVMCGYNWLYGINHPVNSIWKRKSEADQDPLYSPLNKPEKAIISEYIKKANFGTGLGGKKGILNGSIDLASDFGFKFGTVSLK